jgi:hypothetical protein
LLSCACSRLGLLLITGGRAARLDTLYRRAEHHRRGDVVIELPV